MRPVFILGIILLLVGCKQRDERVLMVDEQGVRASRIFSYVAGLVSILSISLVEGTPVEVRRA